jgi:hypothetical protein
MKPRLQLLLASLGLITLCLLREWTFVEKAYAIELNYFRDAAASPNLLIGILAVNLGGAAILFLLALVLNRIREDGRWSEYLFAGVATIAISALLFPESPLPQPWNLVFVPVGLAAGAILWRSRQWSAHFRTLLTYASLLALAKVGSNAYLLSQGGNAARSRYEFKPGPASAKRNSARQPRLVWLLQDELDPRLIGAARPPGLSLPNFDAAIRQGIVGNRAITPASDTLEILPSLIYGHAIEKALPKGPKDLRVEYADGRQATTLRERDSLFAKLASQGLRTGLVGWYHPYCDLPGLRPDACTAYPAMHSVSQMTEVLAAHKGLLWAINRASPIWLSQRGHRYWKEESQMQRDFHLENFNRIHAAALPLAGNPHLDFVFLHYNVPHPQGIYDRATGTLRAAPEGNYLDNLALADRVLGEIRERLPQNTALLITSDHGYRPRVWKEQFAWSTEASELKQLSEEPNSFFLFVPPNSVEALRVEQPFSAIQAHYLTLAYFSGKANDGAAVVEALTSNPGGLSMRK